MKQPLVSVIVCTYNRKKLLNRCLSSLCTQDLDNNLYEVIIVDNNSKDGTSDLVFKYKEKNGSIQYVFEENQGLSYARNRGCSEAKGQYLAYIDDDTIVQPEYLSNVFKVIREHMPDIMGGPVYPYYTHRKPSWFRDKYETKRYEEKSGFSKTCRVTGANFIIKKSVLQKTGMFDVDLGMKGNELGLGEEAKVLNTYRKLTPERNQKVYYALECYVKHYVPENRMGINYLLLRSYKVGRMSVVVKEKSLKIILVDILINYKLMFEKVSQGIKTMGMERFDFVDVIRKHVHFVGMIVEWLNRKLALFERKGS